MSLFPAIFLTLINWQSVTCSFDSEVSGNQKRPFAVSGDISAVLKLIFAACTLPTKM